MEKNLEKSKNLVDSLPFILTLRYNPYLKSTQPKLTWRNFTEKTFSQKPEIFLENYIEAFFINKLKNKKTISISLSGGIDSTLLAGLLNKALPNKKVESISVKFEDSFDETKYAKLISNKLNFNHNVIYIDHFFENLPLAISIVKQPFWDLHWFHLAKEAKSLSNVLISGDGGDELFAGYTFRYKKFLSQISNNSTVDEKINAYLKCHERDWVPDQLDIFNLKKNFSWKKIHQILKPYFDNSLSPLSQVLLADYNGKLLFNMIPNYEKIHNFFNISYIAPFLSKDIVETATKLSDSKKYNVNTNQGKIVLKNILKKLDLNTVVLNRKQGFSVDTKNLWKSSGKKLCKLYLTESNVVKENLINANWINKYIDSSNLDYRYINKFFGILALEIWYRIFITKEMKSNEKLIL